MPLIKKNKKFNGKLLYHRRIMLGLNFKDIATKVGCSAPAVHKWEVGKSKPNPSSMFRLAKALKVKPDYFYLENDKDKV